MHDKAKEEVVLRLREMVLIPLECLLLFYLVHLKSYY